jgi:hypothetical protein
MAVCKGKEAEHLSALFLCGGGEGFMYNKAQGNPRAPPRGRGGGVRSNPNRLRRLSRRSRRSRPRGPGRTGRRRHGGQEDAVW